MHRSPLMLFKGFFVFSLISGVVLRFLTWRGEVHMQRFVLNFAAPVADHHAGNAVADHISKRSRLTHKTVNAENQSQPRHRYVAHSGKGCCQHNEAVTPAAPLEVRSSTASSVTCCMIVILTSQA